MSPMQHRVGDIALIEVGEFVVQKNHGPQQRRPERAVKAGVSVEAVARQLGKALSEKKRLLQVMQKQASEQS